VTTERNEESFKIESQGNSVFFFWNFPPNAFLSNTYGLLTKGEVKVAGYWPRSVFCCCCCCCCCCVFMNLDSVSVHKLKNGKKKPSQTPAIFTEQSLVIYIESEHYRLAPGQGSAILPARVVYHGAGFDSSCPLTELAI